MRKEYIFIPIGISLIILAFSGPLVLAPLFGAHFYLLALLGLPGAALLGVGLSDFISPLTERILKKKEQKLPNVEKREEQGILTLEGHTDRVWAIAVSSDGNYIVSGSRDKTIKVWELKTGKLLRTIAGHKKDITSLGISPNGKYIVSGSSDKTINLWELVTGTLIHTFIGHTNEIRSATFSADGQYLISGSLDSTIRIWNLADKTQEYSIKEYLIVDCVAISPDGKYIVSGTGWCINVWDLKTKSLSYSIENKYTMNYITSVAVSFDGKFFASTSIDNTIQIVELKTGKILYTFKEKKHNPTSISISPNNKYISTGSWDKTVKLWAIQTGQLIHIFQGHTKSVQSIAFSPDSSCIVSGSSDKTIKIWNLKQILSTE